MATIPSDAEFGILTVLWRCGSSTVREVHDALAKGTGYTSTLKQMQVMHEKGLLKRTERYRSPLYESAPYQGASPGAVRRRPDASRLRGSAKNLVLARQLLNAHRLKISEEIRRMFDRFEKKREIAMITILLSEPWVPRLGWTLLHFLWQGTAIVMVYAMLRSWLAAHSRSANGRYILCVCGPRGHGDGATGDIPAASRARGSIAPAAFPQAAVWDLSAAELQRL